MKRLLAGVLAGMAVAPWNVQAPAAEPPEKLAAQPHVWGASLVKKVNPGETVRWRSRRVGKVTDISLVADGAEMFYELKRRTNACVGYGYGQGVAVRLTDCSHGRRVPYVRARVVSAALKPVEIRLRFR